MEIEETSRRLSGVNISGNRLKEVEDNEESRESLSEEDRERFNKYIQHAKKMVSEGNVADALRYNKKALKICHKEKLARKIKKMEDYLETNDEESSEDNNGMTHVGNGFYMYHELYSKLYSHQKEGVLWLWSLFKKKKGGILGDDMGLGKTIQVISFLSGLFDMEKIKSVLIVLPVAVMVNWENEFNKWAPGLKVEAFHGNSKREKERALAKVQRRGGICLTTYGLVVTSWETLGQRDGREFVWDYMILDEGHKIKNPTKTSKGVHAIAARNRIILTGTPVQNNLKELWALFDFVHQGSLLGTQKTFKMEYDSPITRAREKDATMGEKKLGMEMAESLKNIIAPYFLRRTKAEVQNREDKENEDPDGDKHSKASIKMPTMTRKNDLIVWLFMSETQLKIYRDFLELDSVKELLMTKKSPLVALTVLKKICDHPRLLSTKACAQLGVDGDEGGLISTRAATNVKYQKPVVESYINALYWRADLDDEILETEAAELSAATRIQHISDDILVRESGKLVFLIKLLDRLKEEGHRCLVFSQSRKILDIMQKVFTNRGHKVMRLDGTISQVYEREQRIQKFQSDNSYSVFLLTTQVGGVGLTLTAADRVVIFDPSWNPATDAQAVDRAFRIGQNKNVVIYRLITCGTVEEKIYRRQIFKDSITRQTTGNSKNPYRYFSKYELRELFTLDDPHSSTTQQQLEQMHSGHRLTDPSLDEHLAFLYSLEMFGLSDHDLMFGHGADTGDDQDTEVEAAGPETDYIQHRVAKARQLIQMESSQPITLDERLGKVPKPDSSFGNKNQFESWDFPKPSQQMEGNPGEIPGPGKLSPGSNYDDDEIDLTASPRQPVTMPTQEGAIDLTSADESEHEEDIKPLTKTEKLEELSNLADVNQTNIKTEQDILKSLKIKSELKQDTYSDDVMMNSPKPTKTALNINNELNMSVEDHDQHAVVQSEHNDLDMSVDETGVSKATTPLVKKTPKKTNTPRTPNRGNVRTMTEELLISPDSSRPVISTEPKSSKHNVLSKNLVSQPGFASRLNLTILSNLTDTPDSGSSPKSSVSSSGSHSPGRLGQTFIDDSPAVRVNPSTSSRKLVIEDSPEKSPDESGAYGLDESVRLEASMLVDSVLEESVIQDNEENMPAHNEENSGSQSLNTCHKGINGDQRRSGGLSESFNGNLDTSRNRSMNNRSLAEDELPDLDSPVQPRSGIKSKSFKKHVIESSDEQSDADSDGKNSDEYISMNHSDKNEDFVAEHSDHDHDIDMNHSAKNEDLVAEHSDGIDDDDIDMNHSDTNESERHSDNNVRENVNSFINNETDGNSDREAQEDDGKDDDDESGESAGESEGDESSEEEEENGIQDFNSLAVEEQEKYNSLVETGRNTIRVSNRLDPDQARHFVGPDLGPNCLQKLSADNTRTYCQQKQFEMAQACVLQALEIYPDPALQATALKIYQKIVKYTALREQGNN